MSKIEELNNLFDKWKEKQSKERYSSPTIPVQRIDKNSFCYDGYIFNDKIDTVLYILAESNLQGKFKSDDFFWLKGAYKIENNVSKSPIPRRIELMQNYICSKIDDISLQDISYMNINKRGGFSSCNATTLKNYYDEYRQFILEEINIINPKVIVFAVGNMNKAEIKSIYDDIKKEIKCKYIFNAHNHLSSSNFSIQQFKNTVDNEMKGRK